MNQRPSVSQVLLGTMVVMMLLVAVPIGATGAAEPVDEYEPNDTLAEAKPISTDGTAQVHNYEGRRVDYEGRDWLSFEAQAGAVYKLKTWSVSDTNPVRPSRAYFHGPDEQPLEFEWQTYLGGSGGIEWFFYATDAGTHYVCLDQNSHATTGVYSVSLLEGDSTSLGLDDEYEPDNTLRSAKEISVDGSVQRRVNDKWDIARVRVTAGKVYRVDVMWEAQSGYLSYGVYNATGGGILRDELITHVGPGDTRYFRATKTEDLFIKVSNRSGPDRTAYLLSVTEMESSVLSGSVVSLPGDAPFAGALVIVWKTSLNGFFLPTDAPNAVVVSGADGTWSLRLAPGTYTIGFEDPAGLLLTEYHENLVVPDPYGTPVYLGEEQAITIHGRLRERAAVQARVVHAETGSPVPGVTVHLDRRYPAGSWPKTQRVGTAVSDSDGHVTFASLDPRLSHWFTAEPHNGLVRVSTVYPSLSPGVTRSVTIKMSPPGRISGRALDDSRGVPAEGVVVQAFPPTGLTPLAAAVTAADGTFVLDGLLTGQYRVSFTDPAGPDGPYGRVWAGGSEFGHDTPVSVTVGVETTGADAHFVDALPPVTTTHTSSSWQQGPVEISLSAQDRGWMGVGRTWVRMPDSSEWDLYTGPFLWTTEGEHSFEHFSEDNVAADGTTNKESPQTSTVRVDDTAPETVVRTDFRQLEPTPGIIDLTSTDEHSGVRLIRWNVDGRDGSGPIVVLGGPGKHTLTYWAVDNVGNAEEPTIATLTVADALTAPHSPSGADAETASYRLDSAWPLPTGPGIPNVSPAPTSMAYDGLKDVLYLGNQVPSQPVSRYGWDGKQLPSIHETASQAHRGLGVDAAGHLYVIMDSRVQQFTAEGSLLWTSELNHGLIGAGDVSPDGVVWLYQDYSNGRITRVTPAQTYYRSLSYKVAGLAAGRTEIFVADSTNNKVRVLGTAATEIREWSVPGKPSAIEIDEHGYVYVGAQGRIWQYTGAGALIGTIQLSDTPKSISADGVGNLYVYGTSGTLRRYVHARTSCDVSLEHPGYVRYGRTFSLRGRVSPGLAGLTVVLQESAGAGLPWKEIARVSTDSQGRWTQNNVIHEPKRFRAIVPGDSMFAGRVSEELEVAGTPGALDLQHDSAGVTFDRFVTGYNSAYAGGGYVYGKWAGTKLTVTFNGTRIRWIGPTQPNYGRADVYVDGTKVETVECYASDFAKSLSAMLWDSGPLPAGRHTVELRLTGARSSLSRGNVVVVDYFEIGGVPSTGGAVRHDETTGRLSGPWVKGTNSAYVNQGYHYSRYTNASYTKTFTGTKIAWIGPKTNGYGRAKVYIDNKLIGTVSQYGVTAWREKVWESATLSRGTHTLKIVPTGTKDAISKGTIVVIDAFDVTP